MNHTLKNYEEEKDDVKKLNCLKFYLWAMQKDLQSFKMVIADDQYYNKPLEARRDILDAPSTKFICKTIVFENTAYNEKFEGPFYPKYFAVMVQYIARINTEKLQKQMRQWQQKYAGQKASKQYFHFRLADEQISNKLTGYEHNGVIPIMMKTKMPIIFSHEIKNLKPQFFWMGGGHPDIKMRMSLKDFEKIYDDKVIIGDITFDK